MPDRIGQQLGNYQLLHLLGEGSFAEVYLGKHVHLETQAAIKVWHTQLGQSDIEPFHNEARIIAQLEHPHIVRVLDFGVEGVAPFIAMSYARDGTLRTRHPKGTRIPLATVVSYVQQVASALQYAHDHKVIHHDVKPENLLVGRLDDILLSDFGIGLILQSTRYQNTRDEAETIAYMAPEQIHAQPYSASDQYALGIVVYEWLCGDRPFQGSFIEMAAKHSLEPPPSLLEKVPTLPPAVEQAVMTALTKDPTHRFESVQAFANALRDAAQHSPSGSIVSTPTIDLPASTLPPEPVSQPPSSWQPEVLVPPLTETKSTDMEPATQRADTATPSQISQPNHRRMFPRLKRQRVALVLLLLILVLGGAGSLVIYITPQNNTNSPDTTQNNANPSSTSQNNINPLGTSWTAHTSGPSQTLSAVIWWESQFIAVGNGGTILTSPNSISWTPRTSGSSQDLHGIASDGLLFVAVGNGGTILTSPDGISWTPRTSGSSQTLEDIAWSGHEPRFVAVGTSGTILTSPDGTTWTSQTSGSSQDLFGIVWSSSLFVAVGRNGTILTSLDGLSWTSPTSGFSQDLNSIAWSGSLFVAVGRNGTILTSPDGLTWTPLISDISQTLASVTWSSSLFIAVGRNGTILTSPDGLTWTYQTSGFLQDLDSIASSGSQFIAVGNGGTILTSP